MKTAVIGSTGFIGAAVYERLPGARAIATSSTGKRLDRDCDWLKPELDGMDVVFLCAGRTGGVGRMAADPFSFVYPNVRIHMNAFEACAAVGVRRVVCVQSTTGYPDSPEPMREDQYCDGPLHSAYFVPGTAHRFIYHLSKMFKGLEVLFYRPSNVYGPRNSFDPKFSHVIEATVRKVVEKQDPFRIWGTGSETRDAIYIDDLAEAIVGGLECDPGAYNVGTGEEMSVNQIARTLLEYTGHDPLVVYDTSKPTAIPARRVNISKLLNTGWTPRVGMTAGLQKTLDWYMVNAA